MISGKVYQRTEEKEEEKIGSSIKISCCEYNTEHKWYLSATLQSRLFECWGYKSSGYMGGKVIDGPGR